MIEVLNWLLEDWLHYFSVFVLFIALGGNFRR